MNQRIYTISFGTQTIVRARKEFPFKQTLIKCAFELIEEEYDEVLDLEYTILDDVAFKHGQSLLESTPSTEFNQDQRDETTNQNQEIAYEIVAEGNVMDETLLSFDKRDFIINELRNQEGQQMACTAKIPFVNLYFSFFFISPMIKFPSFSAIQTKEEVIILIEEILDEASLVGPFLLDRPSSNQTFAQFMCARFRTLSEGCQCHFLFEFESRIGAFKSLITQEKKLLIVLTKDSPCIWLNFNKMT